MSSLSSALLALLLALHVVGTASWVRPTIGLQSPHPRAAALRANQFDSWWEERRALNTLHNARKQVPASDAPTLERNVESVALVLTEFVRSDYARQCFNHCNAQPTDYGQLEGMFQMVRLADKKLVVKLRRAFDERNDALLDRLTRYLRARIPEIGEIHAIHREGQDIY